MKINDTRLKSFPWMRTQFTAPPMLEMSLSRISRSILILKANWWRCSDCLKHPKIDLGFVWFFICLQIACFALIFPKYHCRKLGQGCVDIVPLQLKTLVFFFNISQFYTSALTSFCDVMRKVMMAVFTLFQ